MKYQRLTAGLLACAMVFGMGAIFPKQAGFQQAELTASAETSYTYENLTYTVDSSGITITGCDKSAETVEIPEKIDGKLVTAIGKSAFSGCDNLKSVVVPVGVTNIGNSAFWNCTNLTSVTLGVKVESIEDCAFEYCNSLTSINIPDSVTSIGYDAFSNCDNLIEVYYGGSEEQWKRVVSTSDWINDVVLFYDYKIPLTISVTNFISLNKLLKTQAGAPLKFDLNGDNVVNVIDLALLKRELLKK